VTYIGHGLNSSSVEFVHKFMVQPKFVELEIELVLAVERVLLIPSLNRLNSASRTQGLKDRYFNTSMMFLVCLLVTIRLRYEEWLHEKALLEYTHTCTEREREREREREQHYYRELS